MHECTKNFSSRMQTSLEHFPSCHISRQQPTVKSNNNSNNNRSVLCGESFLMLRNNLPHLVGLLLINMCVWGSMFSHLYRHLCRRLMWHMFSSLCGCSASEVEHCTHIITQVVMSSRIARPLIKLLEQVTNLCSVLSSGQLSFLHL